jgi:hypothetical protein
MLQTWILVVEVGEFCAWKLEVLPVPISTFPKFQFAGPTVAVAVVEARSASQHQRHEYESDC